MTLRAKITSNDEIGNLKKNFNLFLDAIREIIEDNKLTASENTSISHELSRAALIVGKNIENSLTTVNEATSQAKTMQDDIVISIEDSKKSKEDVAVVADEVRKLAQRQE